MAANGNLAQRACNRLPTVSVRIRSKPRVRGRCDWHSPRLQDGVEEIDMSLVVRRTDELVWVVFGLAVTVMLFVISVPTLLGGRPRPVHSAPTTISK